MARYLCLQRAVPGNSAQGKPSATQMQEMYDAFQRWRARFEGNLTDIGGGLGQGRLVTEQQPAPDGPLVEVKELVGGYMIVTAGNLEEAIEVARACPGLVRPGSGVEVIEIREL